MDSSREFGMVTDPAEVEATSLIMATDSESTAMESQGQAGPGSRILKVTALGSLALVLAASAALLLGHRGPVRGTPGAPYQLFAEGGGEEEEELRRLDTPKTAVWARVGAGKNSACVGTSVQPLGSKTSAGQCRTECFNKLSCKGIEYNHHTGDCTIHVQDIASSEHKPGSECVKIMRVALPAAVAGESDYEPVDGAVNRACTSTIKPVDVFHFDGNLVSVTSLQHCQELCLEWTTCRGITYTETTGQCKRWQVDVDGSQPSTGAKCFKRKAYQYEAVNGGDDMACRGSTAADDLPAYYKADISTETVRDCQLLCLSEDDCKGVEYHFWDGRCERWTRDIGATSAHRGYSCFRKNEIK